MALHKELKFFYYKALDINGKSGAATLLGAPDVANFKPTHVIFDLTSASGVVTPATISVGTNASSYNNMLTSTLLSGLSGVSNSTLIPLSGVMPDLTGGTSIYVNVGVIAVATTYTFNVTLIGFYDL